MERQILEVVDALVDALFLSLDEVLVVERARAAVEAPVHYPVVHLVRHLLLFGVHDFDLGSVWVSEERLLNCLKRSLCLLRGLLCVLHRERLLNYY